MPDETQEPDSQQIGVQPLVTGVQKWFSVDSCGTIEVFDSEENARQSAEEALDFERSEAQDGWSEEVSQIMWGRVIGRAEETMRTNREDCDFYVPEQFDEVVDYGIVPVDSNGDWFDTITNAIGCVRDRRTTANEQGDGQMVKHLTGVIHKLREIRRASR